MSAFNSDSSQHGARGGGAASEALRGGRSEREPESPGRWRAGLELAAVLGAAVVLTYAVAEAAIALAPWGDSPRVFYAALADVGLALGTLLLALAMTMRHRVSDSGRISGRVEVLVYLIGAIAVAIPLAISAGNSFEASANGQGGPSLLLEIVAGVCLTGSVALVMARRVALGFLVSGSLAVLLAATALLTAR